MIGDYIGIPFKNKGCDTNGCDCYGLVRLVFEKELGIILPAFNIAHDESERINFQYQKTSRSNWEQVESPEPFDVVAVANDPRFPNIVQHFGICIDDKTFIHSTAQIGVHVAKIAEYGQRIKGVYRWKQ